MFKYRLNKYLKYSKYYKHLAEVSSNTLIKCAVEMAGSGNIAQ